MIYATILLTLIMIVQTSIITPGTNLLALETEATFDHRTDQFVLTTPRLSSMKWWPGGRKISLLPLRNYICVALSKKMWYRGISLSVWPPIHLPQKKSTLTITSSFLNIFSLNFEIILLMTTQAQWSKILIGQGHYAGVLPFFVNLFVILTKHWRATQVFNWTPI